MTRTALATKQPALPPEQSATRVRIGKHGRVVIPAAHRAALGLQEGTEALLLLHDGKLELHPTNYSLTEARRIFRRHAKAGRSLTRELLAERKREAKRE